MSGPPRDDRSWFDAHTLLTQASPGTISGPWEQVIIVVSNHTEAEVAARVFGGPPGTRQLVTPELAAAYRALAHECGYRSAVWKLAISATVIARKPELRADYRCWDPLDGSNDFTGAMHQLDRSAPSRARHGLGPGPFPADAIDEALRPEPTDPELPSEALAVVAEACRRRTGSRLAQFVACVYWSYPDLAPVMLFGDSTTRGTDTVRFACGSGESAAASQALAAAIDPLGPPRCLFLLVSGTKVADLRVRATRDGEAAVNFLHVTEHARLAALGLLPKRVRRP